MPDLGRSTVAVEIAPGEQLRVIKYVGYGWSSQRSRPALIDQIVGALAGAHLTGWDGLLAEQRAYLDEFWDGADVEVEGDAEVQQAVRFGLFHILQAGARAEYRPIAAKGPDRQRLRRAHLLGHRDVRAARAHVHPAVRRGRRAALAAHGAGRGQAARRRPRPGRGGVPVAHDPRPGVLRLLARRYRRVPHQRRHRRRGGPLPGRHRGRQVRDRGRPRAAGGDRTAVAVAWPARRGRPLQDPGRDRAR